MRVSFKIYTSKLFTNESEIGWFKTDSIPTTAMPYSYDKQKSYFLTNTLEVKTNSPHFDGIYFVNRSVIYVGEGVNYPTIEIFIEKLNDKQDTFLYLKGVVTFTAHEMFIPVMLTGEIEKKTQSLILPRTNLDFISINGMYYRCEDVIHKQDAEVEIVIRGGMDLDAFRNIIIIP